MLESRGQQGQPSCILLQLLDQQLNQGKFSLLKKKKGSLQPDNENCSHLNARSRCSEHRVPISAAHTHRDILEAKHMPLLAHTLLNRDPDYIFCFAIIS